MTLSISRIPGPPAGPSLRMIEHVAGRRSPPRRPRRCTPPRSRTRAPGRCGAGARCPRPWPRRRRARGCRAGRTSPLVGLYGASQENVTRPSGSGAPATAVGERAAGDGRRVAVDAAGADQLADQHRDAAGLLQVRRDVAAAGREARDHRRRPRARRTGRRASAGRPPRARSPGGGGRRWSSRRWPRSRPSRSAATGARGTSRAGAPSPASRTASAAAPAAACSRRALEVVGRDHRAARRARGRGTRARAPSCSP